MNTVLKWTLIVGTIAAIGTVANTSMKANKEVDAKIAFKSNCQRQAQSNSSVPSDRVNPLCSCVVENVTKALGQDGFSRLAMLKNSTEGDRQTLMDTMAKCMEETLPPK